MFSGHHYSDGVRRGTAAYSANVHRGLVTASDPATENKSMSRWPILSFTAPELGRIKAMCNVVPIGEILVVEGFSTAHWSVQLPPLSRAPHHAENVAKAKRELWILFSEWCVAAGLLDPECRARCDDADLRTHSRRPNRT